jgi:hypothetical protein
MTTITEKRLRRLEHAIVPYTTSDEIQLLAQSYRKLQKLKDSPVEDKTLVLLHQALTEGKEQVAQSKLDNLLCIIHRDGGHYISQHGEAKALDDAVKVLFKWREAFDQQVDKECEVLQDQAHAWKAVHGLCTQLGMYNFNDTNDYTGEQLTCEFIRHLANKRMKKRTEKNGTVKTSV